MSKNATGWLGLIVGATFAVGATACSSSPSSSSTTTKSGSSLPTAVIPVASESAALAASVPAAMKSKGALSVAADATYPPDELIAPDGHTVVGFDADLAKAVGQVLGLPLNMVNATFDTIIPGLQSGKFDLGFSSFTDTKDREKVVDMVDYFNSGEGFYVSSGSSLHFDGLASLCGHTVAVETGTTEESDAKTQATTCTSAGKKTVKVLSFSDQNQANLAVSSGRADIGFLDSQVATYVVSISGGQFKNTGHAFSVSPYGLAIPKGTGMAQPILGAVNELIHNGIYGKILAKWGIQAGALPTAVLNGATS
jgi:polar amino acid transport system substrate-binding protein